MRSAARLRQYGSAALVPRRLRVTRRWFGGEGGLGVILANPDPSGSRRGFRCLDAKGSDETGGTVETLKSSVYASSVPRGLE